MIINHNMSAINGHRNLKFRSWSLDNNTQKLSSGMRINKAGDDPAGLAISEKMRSQIRGLRQAERNAEDDISFIQTAEGYLGEIQSILNRLRELAVQAANGVYTSSDRMLIQVEVSQMVDEIDRIASHAQFNELNLLTGRFARPTTLNINTASMWFHIGANVDQRERAYIGTMNSQALGLKSTVGQAAIATFITFSRIEDANANLALIDSALDRVSKQRADLGAYQNRLELASQGLLTAYENIQAAESRIRDTDMAETVIHLVRDQILMQSGTAMLAQANAKSRLVLALLE